MIANLLPLACVATPLFVAALCPVIVPLLKGRHSMLLVAGMGLTLALATAMIPEVMSGTVLIPPQLPMRVDLTNITVVFGIALISFLSAVYNVGSDRGGRLRPAIYDFSLLFLLSIMLGLVMFEDLFWIYLLVETTVGVSIVLVAYAPGKFPIQAAFKYLIITAISAIFFLGGVLIIYWLCRTTDISAIKESSELLLDHEHLTLLAVAFFIVGLGADLGIPPFHGWLPDAFPASTPAINSFMCAESICLLFALCKILYPFYSIYPTRSLVALLFCIGVFSAILGALLAYGQENFWRLAAYITVEGYGHAALAFGLFTSLGFVAGQFYLINGAVMKMGVLQSLGSVFLRTGSASIVELGGLGRMMKKTLSTYLTCALSLGGVPPLSGFFGKLLVYNAVFQFLSDTVSLTAAFLTIILLVGVSVVSLAALVRAFQGIFLGELHASEIREVSGSMWLPAMTGAAFALLLGVYPALLLGSMKPPSLP